MPHNLTFTTRHQYDQTAISISVPVELKVGDRGVRVPNTKLDTGATFCIFQQGIGESLGLDVEGGHQERIATATGQFLAYGHEVLLSALGFEFPVVVYFANVPGFGRNILGRRGWLEQLRIGIIDYDGELFVSAYNDEQ